MPYNCRGTVVAEKLGALGNNDPDEPGGDEQFFSASVALSGVWDSFYGYPTYPPLILCASLACIGVCVVMIYWFAAQEHEFL